MTVFVVATEALFGDPNMAGDALYRAGGVEPSRAIRVIVRQPDRIGEIGEIRIASETMTFDVRTSEIADPAEGDTLDVDGVIYIVQGTPVRDAERLVWTIEARRA